MNSVEDLTMRVKYYDYEKYIGWYSDELINHLKEGFTFKTEEYDTVGDFVILVESKIKPLGSYVDSPFPGDGSLMLKTDMKNVRYVFDEQSKAPLCRLLDNYSKNNELPLMVCLVTGGRGEVFHDEGEDLGVTFLFHSNEGNHLGRPHVHVIDRNTFSEISIDLKTMKIMKHSTKKENSKFSGKKFKKVQKFIANHLKDFQKYWNETTNGFKIEIDM